MLTSLGNYCLRVLVVVEHAVDQPGYRPHPRRVLPAAVPAHLAQRLIPAQPVDPVLHPDPPPRERPVVAPVLRGPAPAPRLAPRRRPLQPRADGVDADVAQVPQRPDAGPDQLAHQPRAPEHLEVGPAPRPAGADIDDVAVLVHGDLALERVRLLLARVVGALPPRGPL